MHHHYRHTIFDPETGLYWNGSPANGFQTDPHYWYEVPGSSQARSDYAAYLLYSASLVNKNAPMRLKILTETVLYSPPVESDLCPTMYPHKVAIGAFERFFRPKVNGPKIKWAVTAFGKNEFKDLRADIFALMRCKSKVTDDIPVARDYGTSIYAARNIADVIMVRSSGNMTAMVDLEPFWRDFETRYPGCREAMRTQ